jgi:hypothetical protein
MERKNNALAVAKEVSCPFRSIGLSSEKLIGKRGDGLGHILRIGNEATLKPEQRIKYVELKVIEETQDQESSSTRSSFSEPVKTFNF